MRAALGVALLLVLAGTAVAQEADRVFPFDYRLVELENGFKAYLGDAGAPGQIAYVSIVRTGSRDEVEEGKSGFAHFFEHMMFRGTAKYPDFDAVTSAMGAARNADCDAVLFNHERTILVRIDHCSPAVDRSVPVVGGGRRYGKSESQDGRSKQNTHDEIPVW